MALMTEELALPLLEDDFKPRGIQWGAFVSYHPRLLLFWVNRRGPIVRFRN